MNIYNTKPSIDNKTPKQPTFLKSNAKKNKMREGLFDLLFWATIILVERDQVISSEN